VNLLGLRSALLQVMDTEHPLESELVQGKSVYWRRILPYYAKDGEIAGAMLMFLHRTPLHTAEKALHERQGILPPSSTTTSTESSASTKQGASRPLTRLQRASSATGPARRSAKIWPSLCPHQSANTIRTTFSALSRPGNRTLWGKADGLSVLTRLASALPCISPRQRESKAEGDRSSGLSMHPSAGWSSLHPQRRIDAPLTTNGHSPRQSPAQRGTGTAMEPNYRTRALIFSAMIHRTKSLP
jgi:hypothetical protein